MHIANFIWKAGVGGLMAWAMIAHDNPWWLVVLAVAGAVSSSHLRMQ